MKQLRDYQEAAIQSIFDYYSAEKQGNILLAIPTGLGKSLIMAEFIRRIYSQWPGQRILALTHCKNLITQVLDDELVPMWPNAPAGVCSAGLGRLETDDPIIFGGIQSVDKRAARLGHRDLILIDEVHLLSPKDTTRYQKTLSTLKEINPALKVIGLTATPWRLGLGLLTNGNIFDEVVFDLCSMDNFNRMVEQGYLVPPIPYRTSTEYDVSNITTKGGEYSESEVSAKFDREDINVRCCEEMANMAQDRKSWLVFCSSIKHSENVNEILNKMGVKSGVVHSKLPHPQNDKTLADWKAGRIQCIVNKDMLTTGVNNRACDFIGMMRPTTSSALFCQAVGRGLRPCPESGKVNCVVADFAGNTRRLGPINDPVIPRPPGCKSGPSEAPIKICPNCGVYNHASARICCGCGQEFPPSEKLKAYASSDELVRTNKPLVVEYDVKQAFYRSHTKKGSNPCLRVSYHCGAVGVLRVDEWVHFEAAGYASKKARDWWKSRGPLPVPSTTEEAVRRGSELQVPKKIKVQVNLAYPTIVGVELPA